MRNSLGSLADIRGVKESVGVNGSVSRIGKQAKRKFALSVLCDLGGETATLGSGIDTDRKNDNLFILS